MIVLHTTCRGVFSGEEPSVSLLFHRSAAFANKLKMNTITNRDCILNFLREQFCEIWAVEVKLFSVRKDPPPPPKT